jgi:2-polyprenyl-3-methyl-5-hydroxy-6-metoxy-1,4-benzoquinol methylase
VAIDEATSYSKERGFQKHAAYMVCDLDEVERGPFGEALPGNAIFTCLEVLEHLEDDLALVKRIPPGFLFIASVPNSPSVAHVRTFPTVGSVFERYGRELILERWQRIELDERHGIHLFQGRRRSDSW